VAEGAAGERTERPVPGSARPDRRPRPLAGEARPRRRLRFLEDWFGAVYSDKAWHPPLPTRLTAGLAILKSMHDLSDEALRERWVENSYFSCSAARVLP
jgi:hypothetical protein